MTIKRSLAIRWTCALALPLCLTIAALAAAKFTVTATISNCCDSNNNPYTLQSDGGGPYSTGSGVDSEITPNVPGAGTLYYQWSLDLTNSSRSFYLTLSPVNGSPSVFSGSLPFSGQLYSRCFTSSGGYQNWIQIQPQYPDTNCAMRANFTYNGATYTLVMSPSETGTGTATVTCTNWNTSSKSCTAWTDVPTAGITNANVANLYNGGMLVGQYYLSFNITLSHR